MYIHINFKSNRLSLGLSVPFKGGQPLGQGPHIRDLEKGVLKPQIRDPIPAWIYNQLPSAVRSELAHLSDREQTYFVEEFRRRCKRVFWAYTLWFLLGWHYIYLRKWGLQFLYWLTLGGLWIWALLDLFRVPGMVRNYNKDIAFAVLKDMRSIDQP